MRSFWCKRGLAALVGVNPQFVNRSETFSTPAGAPVGAAQTVAILVLEPARPGHSTRSYHVLALGHTRTTYYRIPAGSRTVTRPGVVDHCIQQLDRAGHLCRHLPIVSSHSRRSVKPDHSRAPTR